MTDMPPEIVNVEGPALCSSERHNPIAVTVGQDDMREYETHILGIYNCDAVHLAFYDTVGERHNCHANHL